MSDIVEGEGSSEEQPKRPEEYVAEVSFQDLNLAPELLRALSERGYSHPTPVQAKAFAPAVEGRDLIVRSKTGTGKTAAFGLPLLQKIDAAERRVKALILCPTRELALQVAAELGDLGKYKGIKIATIYGGASMKVQEDALEAGSQIVVGTPGRVYDHIRRKTLKLEDCTHAVLDEADEMLNQGFFEEVTRILDCLPDEKQILLFSATVPPDIQNLISKYTDSPETLLLSGDQLTVEHIHHIAYEISEELPKPRQLVHVLEMNQPENAIVFCNTRDDTTLVSAVLNRNGFDAEVLNGDLPQKERERVMAKVKRGEVEFMVATDIAARGIDISGLQYVVNYSLPEDPAVYLHRVGRTGRIGNKGTAINLLSGRERMTFKALEGAKYNIKFEKRPMPSPEEAMARFTERHIQEIKDGAAGSVYEGMLPLAHQVKSRNDSDDLVAFLLKYFFTHHRMEKVQAQPEEHAPQPRREERPRDEKRGGRERDRGGRDRERERERERKPRREAKAEAPSDEQTERVPKAEGEAVDSTAVTPPEGTPAVGRAPRERRDRGPREAPKPIAEGQVRLWVNLGRTDKMNPEELAKVLEAAGAPTAKIGSVDIRGNFSFVDVAEADAAAFEAVSGKPFGTRKLKIERAKPA